MINKVITGILVLLLIITGGLCFYVYTLSQQINSLSEQLAASQQEQAARIGSVSDELTTFSLRTLSRFGILENDVGEATNRLDTLQDEMRDEIRSIATEFSQSLMNASEVYQRARQAVVRVSDGERTVGTGFILDTEGHIVTAHHVIERHPNLHVILSDGTSMPAMLTGTCQYSDIAVLTMEEAPIIEPLVLADSAMVRIGEPVVTIGNPFDLTETLTSGIVSQTNRFAEIEYISQSRWVANLIQFDAPANFGNSGGPLLNAGGEVIGMVIARVNPNEGDGIYYAVSANKLNRVITALIDHGYYDYPWLGVEIANLTPQMVQDRGLETANGALVKRVLTDSPARTAGIKVDDIIIAFDGTMIRDIADLTSYLGEHKSPDDTVNLTLIQNTTKLDISLKIGKQISP